MENIGKGIPKTFSPYFSRENVTGSRGPGNYVTKEIYEYLFTNADKDGILVYNIPELAEAVQLRRNYLTNMVKNFVEVGIMERLEEDRRWKVLFHPDSIDWDNEEFKQTLAELRANNQWKPKNKEKENAGNT